MRLPRALLLDLDDTIVSFTASPRDFWTEAYRSHQDRLPGIPEERFRRAIRESAGEYWSEPNRAAAGRLDLVRARRSVVQGAFQRIGFSDPVLRDEIADHFTAQKENAVAPFPGALEALSGLRERISRMGLVSNGGPEFQRRKLERYHLERYFDAILIEGEFGVGKPDGRIFREALSQLGVAADETWMVGDNLQMDVRGAQQAGIVAVWVDIYGSGVPPDADVIPDRIIKHIGDLLT